MRFSLLQNGGLNRLISTALLLLSFTPQLIKAQIPLDLNNPESIKSAAAIAAKGMMNLYSGDKPGQIPGLFPGPYYWWESGAAFGALVDYWYYTQNTEYVNATVDALLHQTGPQFNYMPRNQSKSLGNDDQCFWALTVMAAAEKKFPDPPADRPQWLALAQAVFNSQTKRWEMATCNGGLRWQIFTFNKGYDYKNSISNGCFFQLGARLARYTRNETYAEWAVKAYDWVVYQNLLDETYRVFDGVDVESDGRKNCTKKDVVQWSYNAGTFIAGAAYMYNYTESAVWKERLDGLVDAVSAFFAQSAYNQGEDGVMFEVACEAYNICNIDQRSFKAYLSRFMALAIKVAPHTREKLLPRLQISARAAAKQCSAQPGGNTCTLRWTHTLSAAEKQAYTGLGEQMAALEVIQSNLIDYVEPPVTEEFGTSKGDPTAGMGDDMITQELNLDPVSTGDKVGAGFLTAIVLSGIFGGAYWMVV